MTSIEIAKSLLTDVSNGNYLPLLLLLIAAPILSADASIVSYFKTRSKIEAELEMFNLVLNNEIIKIENLERTKLDVYNQNFSTLLAQQQTVTKEIELVKVGILQKDWAEKEWKLIRVKKIEELMTLVKESEEWLDEQRNKIFAGNVTEKIHPFDSLITITMLYLPELKDLTTTYTFLCREIRGFLGQKFQQCIEIRQDAETKLGWNPDLMNQEISEKLTELYTNMLHPKNQELYVLQLKIAAEARKLVEKLFLHSDTSF